VGWFNNCFNASDRITLNKIWVGVQKIMATEADLAAGIATIKTDLDAVGTGITAVQTALAGLQAGTMTQAQLDQAVADLAAAHTSAQASVAALGTIAANP
jgi:hypothetical protein